MSQLRSLQNELKNILSMGSSQSTSRLWPEGLPPRLEVYKNTVHGNSFDTLDSDFPLTKKQYSENEWLSLSQDFFQTTPPDFWELNQCVAAFPKFLKKKKAKAWIVELAEYEWNDLVAFIHPSGVKKHLGQTNPSTQTHVFQFQIFDWVNNEKADPAKTPRQKPEVLVFYRNSKHEGFIRRADPLMLMLMDHFSKPGAFLDDAEEIRENLLPGNRIPLKKVLAQLVKNDLILL